MAFRQFQETSGRFRRRATAIPLGNDGNRVLAARQPPKGDGSAKETVDMISQAKANFQRISPRKARMIANLVRGRDASEAIQLLDFTPKAGAPFIKKLIASAVANARQLRPSIDVDKLFVSKATVDKGPNSHLRRWRPRAMGRATQITKGVSHIYIELDER